jgi:Spy/CpxP family protein refolding chaperone
MMKSRWSKLSGVLVLVGALATACSSGENASPAPSSEDVGKAPLAEGASKAAAGDKAGDGRREGARGKRGGKHGFGHDNLLRTALHELELSDAQETAIKGALEKLREDAGEHPRDAAWHAALAEGVRAGSIDKAAVEAKLAKMEGGFEEHRARMAEALTTLHATLTKEQRRALVDAVAAKMEEKGARGPKGDMDGEGRRGKGEKGDGERDGRRGKGEKGERGGWGDHGMKGGPLGHMLRDLNLTEEQRSKIDKALEASRPSEGDMEEKKEAFEARRAEMKAKIEGFAADSFDAKAFLAGDVKKGKNPKAHLDRMVTSLSAILPILTPEQRTSLADKLEKGRMGKPEHGEKRGEEQR